MPSKSWIASRLAIGIVATAIGFLISNGFQFNRIFGLILFSVIFAAVNNLIWYFVFGLIRFLTYLSLVSPDRESKNLLVAFLAEMIIFHLYVVVSFLIYFAPLVFGSRDNANFGAAGAGGRVLIENGELTLFGMSSSLFMLVSAYVTASIVLLAGIIYVLLKNLYKDSQK